MSRLQEEDDPYLIEEPSDEEPAQSRSRGGGGARFSSAGASVKGRQEERGFLGQGMAPKTSKRTSLSDRFLFLAKALSV